MMRTSPRHLRARFPGVHVVQGDAFDLDRTLGRAARAFRRPSSPACRC